jgi:signal-transduction protein with cAMP-binding, CBS, and nucleotidyltransferase domain
VLATKGQLVHTIPSNTAVADAVQLLHLHGVGALVVTGDTAPLVGIVSERDVVRHLAARGVGVLHEPVSALMSSPVTTCTRTTTCAELMLLMTDERVRHVPVVEESVLYGLVSIGDVVKARVDELERERRDLIEYVSAR